MAILVTIRMKNPKRRSLNQIKEDISYRILQQKIPETWVIHDYGPDYGIDYVIELFDYVDENKTMAETLGEQFYVQLKSSDSIYYTTRRVYPRGNVAKGPLNQTKDEYIDIEVANFQLDTSDILTVQMLGPAVPVLLVLIDVETERAFFVCLNDYIEKIIIPEDPLFNQKGSKQIQIPLQNEILPLENNLVPLRNYGKRAKMYAAFTRFSYQRNVMHRTTNHAHDLAMLKVFTESSIRQDIWRNHDFWQPMLWSHKELQDVQNALNSEIHEEDFQGLWDHCYNYVWYRLSNLSNIYEELVREWYLPSFLAQLTSYPTEPDIKKIDG